MCSSYKAGRHCRPCPVLPQAHCPPTYFDDLAVPVVFSVLPSPFLFNLLLPFIFILFLLHQQLSASSLFFCIPHLCCLCFSSYLSLKFPIVGHNLMLEIHSMAAHTWEDGPIHDLLVKPFLGSLKGFFVVPTKGPPPHPIPGGWEKKKRKKTIP